MYFDSLHSSVPIQHFLFISSRSKLTPIHFTVQMYFKHTQTYLQHLCNLCALLSSFLRLDEQLLQQRLFIELTDQLTLQLLLHKIHQEVHHRLWHTTQSRKKTSDVKWLLVIQLFGTMNLTCPGCSCARSGSSTWWAAGWPHSPSSLECSACGMLARPTETFSEVVRLSRFSLQVLLASVVMR